MSLITPTNKRRPDPLAAICGMINGGKVTNIVQDGYVIINHWSPEWEWDVVNNFFAHMGIEVPRYGVCDSVEQFDQKYGDILRDDRVPWAVFFVHIKKDPSNAGHGGGWRWHKWGDYHGEGEPTREYLDDEREFDDGVYTFHVYEVDDGSQ